MSSSLAPALNAESQLDSRLVLLLAIAAGTAAASLYYNQPLLSSIAAQFQVSAATVGRIPTLTQLGYAIGLLLLAPLGDRFDRRRIILIKCTVLCGALLAAATSHSVLQLCAASIVIGLSATLAQDCVPAAAALSPELQRGRIVGTVMTGLLLGILLSRVISGAVGEQLGWRTMFTGAAALIAALCATLAWRLPRCPPSTHLPYFALLGSLFALWRQHAAMRRAALAQAFLSLAFSGFWSTLAIMLYAPPFELGSTAAGAFGLAGAAGALIAPLAGAITDRRGPESLTRLGPLLVLLAFVMMGTWSSVLWIIALGAVLFDLGVQASLIAHQSIIYRIDPAARSRLNALLIGAMFIGMALGAALCSLILSHASWRMVCAFAAAAAAAALLVRLWPSDSCVR
jgi:predicted MFS family arabinose efflux permease